MRSAGSPSATALANRDSSQRNAQLLQALALYATAAEHARLAGWPEEAWITWRHRRASLARVLARLGMMPQVAAAYSAVLERAGRDQRTLVQ